MSQEMKFQDPGEGIHEGEVVEILVSEGDTVSEGDEVLVIETDKATTSLPAPHSGKVAEIKVSEGDDIRVGKVLLVFGEGDDQGGESQNDQQENKNGKRSSGSQDRGEESGSNAEQQDADDESKERRGGKSFAVGELPEDEKRNKKASKSEESDQAKREPADDRPVPASPATRRLARDLEVDLRDIEPSGPHGRVTDDDVRAAAEGEHEQQDRSKSERTGETQDDEEPRRERAATNAGREQPQLPDFERFGKIERVPLRSVRRATAKRMTLSWQQIPHVCHHDSADITELERWRRDRSAAVSSDDQHISLMVLVMKAVAGLLKRYPRFNASLDTEQSELILKDHCHLGVAVDTERGLIVGVVRDVDRTPLVELAEKTEQMLERVRSGDVKREELQGATFTVTNVGPLGGTSFEPLVNFPQAAILGMARARLQQVVSGDLDDPRTEVRYLLPLSLSYDHRINDGADAARFMTQLCDTLRNADSLLMNI